VPSFEDVRRFAVTLPDTLESTSYNTPAVKVSGKLMARLREDGVSLAIRATLEARTALPQLEPEVFSVPEHYANSDMFVIHLISVKLEDLHELLRDAWRIAAPKKLLEHNKNLDTSSKIR
jgi:hypothetical protein